MNEISRIQKETRRLTDFAAALDAETVKITITDSEGKTTEKEIDATRIHEETETLLKAREAGSYISMKPMSQDKNFIVVSGLTEFALESMKKDGYNPAIEIEAEQGKYQALFKINECPQGKLEALRETLCNRYGDGRKEEYIAVPGQYYNSHENFPCIVAANPAAATLGAARLLERLEEQKAKYIEQEKAVGQKAKVQEAEKAIEEAPKKLKTLLKTVFQPQYKEKENNIENKKIIETEQEDGVISKNDEKKLAYGENKEQQSSRKEDNQQEQKSNYGIFDLIKEFIMMIMKLVALATQTLYNEIQARRGREAVEMPNIWAKGNINDEQILKQNKHLLEPEPEKPQEKEKAQEQVQEKGQEKEKAQEQAKKKMTVQEIAKAAVAEQEQKNAAKAVEKRRKTMENAKGELKKAVKDKGLSL